MDYGIEPVAATPGHRRGTSAWALSGHDLAHAATQTTQYEQDNIS